MSEALGPRAGQPPDDLPRQTSGDGHAALRLLVERTRDWARRAHAEGWLSSEAAGAIERVEPTAPADLFSDPDSRPLVVAFFGGTGVGKSSLLNRLAGASVARVGVQRPTSREVTLYVHESVGLYEGSAFGTEGLDFKAQIPDATRPTPTRPAVATQSPRAGPDPGPGVGTAAPPIPAGPDDVTRPSAVGPSPGRFPDRPPLHGIVVHKHANPAQRDVAWIDMPDIDSAHEANRLLALRWLPHIDLLVYVVSPERYRDDAGWRLLLEQGGRHAWMFVINRWDEGDAAQREDFAAILRAAGFERPLLFCTCCVPGGAALPSPDEFDRVQCLIHDMIEEHGVRELERLGLAGRLRELREALLAAARNLGGSQDWNALLEQWRQRWAPARNSILEGAEWPIQMIAARLAVRQRPFLARLGRRVVRGIANAGAAPVDPASPAENHAAGTRPQGDERSAGTDQPDLAAMAEALWDDWARSRTASAIDALEVDARRIGLPDAPIRTALASAADEAGPRVARTLEQALRTALARPGAPLQRAARRMTGFLTALLPALALAWIASVVVGRFYAASRGQGAFLGLDFATHAALLVLVAWAVPATFDRLLRPALERELIRALRSGLVVALDTVEEQMRSALERAARRAHGFREEGLALATHISGLICPSGTPRDELSRFVPVQS